MKFWNIFSSFASTDTGEVISTVSLPDAPIAGLENSFGYRVVVDPDSPNRIRLVTTLRAAERAGVVDLVAGGSGGRHRPSRRASPPIARCVPPDGSW